MGRRIEVRGVLGDPLPQLLELSIYDHCIARSSDTIISFRLALIHDLQSHQAGPMLLTRESTRSAVTAHGAPEGWVFTVTS
jgi:hypothetical protein